MRWCGWRTSCDPNEKGRSRGPPMQLRRSLPRRIVRVRPRIAPSAEVAARGIVHYPALGIARALADVALEAGLAVPISPAPVAIAVAPVIPIRIGEPEADRGCDVAGAVVVR